MNRNDWLPELRSLFEQSTEVDWGSHMAELNQRLGLQGPDGFRSSFAGLPPIWFNGDIESIEPRDWTLVISLNHQLPSGKEEVSKDTFWDFCRTHNTRYWYPRFFRPLVRVAATARGQAVLSESQYATRQMVFVELCPYASQRFVLDPKVVQTLVKDDLGFRLAARVTSLLMGNAAPALVLLNGSRTIENFEVVYAEALREWTTESYPSVDAHGRTRWHKQGFLDTALGMRPVAGFPFLRTMSSANSNAEISQLGSRLHAFLNR